MRWYLKNYLLTYITDLAWNLQGLGWSVGVERVVGSQGRAPQKEEMRYLWEMEDKRWIQTSWPVLTAHPNHSYLPTYCPNHVLVSYEDWKVTYAINKGWGTKENVLEFPCSLNTVQGGSWFQQTGSLGLIMSWMSIHPNWEVLGVASDWEITKQPSHQVSKILAVASRDARWEALMLWVLGNYGCW